MTDTPAAVEARVRALLMGRSGGERLLMGCSMFDTARAFVRAGLGDPAGRDHSSALRVQLFLRTYGADFDAATRERIVAHLQTRR